MQPWLTVSTSANAASGDFVTTITAKAGASMAATDYNGTVTISGSSFAADNKQIAVTLNVTTQPIAQASSNTLTFNIAQGAAGADRQRGGDGCRTRHADGLQRHGGSRQ